MTAREQSADRGARVGAELRALAEAATPGGWCYLGSSTSSEEYGHRPGSSASYASDTDHGMAFKVTNTAFGRQSLADAAFIAAANPATVLALLDRLEAAEALVDDFEKRARMASIEAQTERSRRANSRARTYAAVACAWFDARAELLAALGEQGATSVEAVVGDDESGEMGA